MEIKKENLKKVKKLLSKIPFDPVKTNKSTFFFPIESNSIKSDDTFIVSERINSRSSLKAGLTLNFDTEKEEVFCNFGFANLEYTNEFNLSLYLDIMSDLNDKEKEGILQYKCYLIDKSYIAAEFYL